MKEEIQREIVKYFQPSENENPAYQNLWDAIRELLRQKLVALNICIRKDKMSEIQDLSFHLKKLEKEDQIKTKVSSKREMIKNKRGNKMK